MPKFLIQHSTRYLYEQPVRDSASQIMLYPITDEFQEPLKHVIIITGDPPVHVHTDYYGNQVGTFTYAQPHHEMVIHSRLNVETKSRILPADDVPSDLQWKELKLLKQQLTHVDYLRTERFDRLEEVEVVVESERRRNSTPLQSATHLCQNIFDSFAYKKGITTVESTVEEIWKLKSGVCQDFAHILLVMLRLLDIPARYVSGYICTKKTGIRGEGATHAWVEAYIPYYGWLGFDPTNNCIVNETHVRLAVGKNFSDCSPVKGTYRGTSDHTMEVAVNVSYEDGTGSDEHTLPMPATSASKNSFQRHRELQLQQQQQQQ
jgi:transglutaminase-like putative cysteine protease